MILVKAMNLSTPICTIESDTKGFSVYINLSCIFKWVKSLICVRFFATPWTVVYQAPPSMGFSRQEYWSGLPFPSPGDLPNPGIDLGLLHCRRQFFSIPKNFLPKRWDIEPPCMFQEVNKKQYMRTSLLVWWLRLYALIAEGPKFDPWLGN